MPPSPGPASIIIGAVAGRGLRAASRFNLPGKFSDAERNDSSSYLPGDAESTRALEATKELTEGEQAAMVIVYRREGGLTAADRATGRAPTCGA